MSHQICTFACDAVPRKLFCQDLRASVLGQAAQEAAAQAAAASAQTAIAAQSAAPPAQPPPALQDSPATHALANCIATAAMAPTSSAIANGAEEGSAKAVQTTGSAGGDSSGEQSGVTARILARLEGLEAGMAAQLDALSAQHGERIAAIRVTLPGNPPAMRHACKCDHGSASTQVPQRT